MINYENEAWEAFLKTGRISDYMRYSQIRNGWMDEGIEGEEDPDADEYTGGGNRNPGY